MYVFLIIRHIFVGNFTHNLVTLWGQYLSIGCGCHRSNINVIILANLDKIICNSNVIKLLTITIQMNLTSKIKHKIV